MAKKQNNKAFTLLELSISIAIIALIVVSITAGTSLKRQLEINQIIDDITTIKEAVVDFKERTSFLPGDYPMAETAYGTTGNNGDGNFSLQLPANNQGGDMNEKIGFWQHLALEGLIEGTYDPSETINSLSRMSGPIDNSLYFADTWQQNSWWGGGNTHGDLHIRIGKGPDQGTTEGGYGILTTKEAYNLDAKYDDHDPNTGNIRAREENGVTNKCISSNAYNLANTEDTPCIVHFFLGVN